MNGFMNPMLLRAQRLADQMLNHLRLRRKRAYVAVFTGDDGAITPAGQIVLGDMRDFCRAAQSTFDPDPRTHALLEGRREVWLRLIGHLHISEAAIIGLDPDRPIFNQENDDGD